jgi:hypothetical protein
MRVTPIDAISAYYVSNNNVADELDNCEEVAKIALLSLGPAQRGVVRGLRRIRKSW